MKNPSVTFLRGFGQIMLQKSALTGLLFLVGIGINSPVMLVGGILGTLAGLLTAKLLRAEEDSITSGLYGFNAALVGVAIFFFHQPSLGAVLLLLAGASLSSFLMWLFLTKVSVLPAFTAPFVLASWVALFVADMAGVDVAQTSDPVLRAGDPWAVLRGIGQVIFQGYWITGAVFVLGLFVHSRIGGAWAIVGSALGLLLARTFGFPEELSALGIYGFNAALVGIALSSQHGKNALPVLAGIALSVGLTEAFNHSPLPALTAPFVLATWTMMLLNRANIKKTVG